MWHGLLFAIVGLMWLSVDLIAGVEPMVCRVSSERMTLVTSGHISNTFELEVEGVRVEAHQYSDWNLEDLVVHFKVTQEGNTKKTKAKIRRLPQAVWAEGPQFRVKNTIYRVRCSGSPNKGISDIPEFDVSRVYQFLRPGVFGHAKVIKGSLERLKKVKKGASETIYAEVTGGKETYGIANAIPNTNECKSGVFVLVDSCFPKFCGDYTLLKTLHCEND